MLLKIYLGISILTFICFSLANLSAMKRAKDKYGEKLDSMKNKSDFAGSILAWLKIVIASFIPIYHILLLGCLVFMGDKITARSDELIKTALIKAEKENN